MSPTTSAATAAQPATTPAFGEAAKTADVLHFPDGENLSTKEATALLALEELKADHPAFVETAERLYPASVKGQTQYMMQVIAQAEAIANRTSKETNTQDISPAQALQMAADPSKAHIKAAAEQEGHGVEAIFSGYYERNAGQFQPIPGADYGPYEFLMK